MFLKYYNKKENEIKKFISKNKLRIGVNPPNKNTPNNQKTNTNQDWLSELNKCDTQEMVESLYIKLRGIPVRSYWMPLCMIAEDFSKHPCTPNWILKDMMPNPASYHARYPKEELKRRLKSNYDDYMSEHHYYLSVLVENIRRKQHELSNKDKIHISEKNEIPQKSKTNNEEKIKLTESDDDNCETIIINFPNNL